MEEKRGFYYVVGKITSLVGAGMLLYLWLDKTFMRKGDMVQTQDGKNALIITDENKATYLKQHPNYKDSYVLEIPNETDIVLFDTKALVSVHNIMPRTGEFANGKDIKIGGNFAPYLPSSSDTEEYQFSDHIYNDMTRNDGSTAMYMKDQNFIELTCWRKIWWFSV